MSASFFAELAATCNALGFYDGSKYYADPHCTETIKDLIRFLRRDDENHEIRRHLGEANLLKTDLLPILKQNREDKEEFDVLLRLLVNLTNPALLVYREELPADKVSRNYYLQIISHLQKYKEAFADEGVWAILCSKLSNFLQIEWQERGEENGLVIERILILVRNVLQVPSDPEAEKRPDNDASVHDQVLWALHQSGMVDVFLYIASSENEQQYYMHILEIVSLMLREQNPQQLADAVVTRSVKEKERDESELLMIREKEVQSRQQKIRKYTGARHSRFGGTFVVKDIKSISDQDLIYHKPLNSLDALNFDHDKTKLKVPKNKLGLKGDGVERRSAFSIRLFLKEFCVEFLHGAYNTLMYHVKDVLVRAKTQANDESYYFWAMKFFMEFNRYYKFQIKFVSETMTVQSFHYIQTQIENCIDHMSTDKKKLQLWSRRMHLALKAYQELLMTLNAMDKCDDNVVKESSRVIKNNVFYVIEYRELIIHLLLTYNEVKLSRTYLKDLIETIHIFLKLLEQFCGKSHVVVQKIKKTKAKKKKPDKSVLLHNADSEKNLEELWDEISQELSIVLQNDFDLPSDVIPFDATLDKDIDEQRIDAMKRIQMNLRRRELPEAVALFRASREVWPEDDCFGSANMAMEEEFLAFRDIFMADLQQPLVQPLEDNNPVPDEEGDNRFDEEEEDEEDYVDTAPSIEEQSFRFMDFVIRFCHPNAVKSCALLLKNFTSNSQYTNHCIIKMLHRLAFDCGFPAICFQASLFCTFQQILENKLPQYKELAKFAVYIIRKFTECAQRNPKIYVELLFWKTKAEAYEIEHGYSSYQGNAAKKIWSEEEENELRHLHEEYLTKEGNLENDMVHWIQANLINKDHSDRGIKKKLKELGLFVPENQQKSKQTKEWEPEELTELRELFEQYKDSGDTVNLIINHMQVPHSKKQVIDKLLELGVVHDRKQLHKKQRKSKKSNKENEEHEEATDDEYSSDNSEIVTQQPNYQTTHKPKQSKPKLNRKNKQNHFKKTVSYSATKVAQLLRDALSAGLQNGLEWLKDSLLEEASDRENEDAVEGIPLLPITEEEIAAMDNPQFLSLLSALGICPPSDEQEMYWRIPANLSFQDLIARVQVITEALNGNSPDILSTAAEHAKANPSDSDSDGNLLVPLNFQKNLSGPKINGQSGNDEPTSQNMNEIEKDQLLSSSGVTVPVEVNDSETECDFSQKEGKGKKRLRKVLSSDSEEDDEGKATKMECESIENGNDGISEGTQNKKKNSRLLVTSESESDHENCNKDADGGSIDSSKRLFDSDTDSEKPLTKKSKRIVLSDDED